MESPDTPWAKDIDIRITKPKLGSPHSAAIFFYELLKSEGVVSGRLIEIGGGHGRNAVFFAEKGFEVHCVDRDSVPDLDLHGITSHSHDIKDFWHFENNYFDFALDVSCYSKFSGGEKQNYRNELGRVLRSSGVFLLSVPEKEAEKIQKEFSGFKVHLTKDIGSYAVMVIGLP
jgi:SAM-dependent methyltransferase